MKSFSLFVFGLVLLFVFSCKKDDSDELIIGNWKISSEFKECDDPTENEEILYNNGCLYKEVYTCCEEVTFHGDKSFTFLDTDIYSDTTETFIQEGTYSIDDNKLTLRFIGFRVILNFAVSENLLSLKEIEEFDNCKKEYFYAK